MYKYSCFWNDFFYENKVLFYPNHSSKYAKIVCMHESVHPACSLACNAIRIKTKHFELARREQVAREHAFAQVLFWISKGFASLISIEFPKGSKMEWFKWKSSPKFIKFRLSLGKLAWTCWFTFACGKAIKDFQGLPAFPMPNDQSVSIFGFRNQRHNTKTGHFTRAIKKAKN